MAGRAPVIALGDAARDLPATTPPADLVLTSPPYSNVTNYPTDNWLRLWALGEGPSLPGWRTDQKFVNTTVYRRMLRDCLVATRAQTHSGTIWYIRADARPRTWHIIRALMQERWICCTCRRGGIARGSRGSFRWPCKPRRDRLRLPPAPAPARQTSPFFRGSRSPRSDCLWFPLQTVPTYGC